MLQVFYKNLKIKTKNHSACTAAANRVSQLRPPWQDRRLPAAVRPGVGFAPWKHQGGSDRELESLSFLGKR